MNKGFSASLKPGSRASKARERAARMEKMASTALGRLESLIAAMERAADQVARGDAPERIEVGEHLMCMSDDESEPALVCLWRSEDCYHLLEAAASEAGICLDEAEELSVEFPEAEFEGGMVTGGFMAWKGASVEMKSDLMEEILDCICQRLKERGLDINCSDDEYVIIHLPLRGRGLS